MQANEHFKYMQMAVAYGAVALENKEVPVTAVLVHNESKEVLFKAHNMTNITLNGTAHAEFIIYKHLMEMYPDSHLEKWKKSTLYVTVEPCIMCASMLDQVGISTVVFGCPNERFGGNGSVFNIRYNSNYKIIPGVCHKDGISLLRQFYINENDRSPNSINKKKRVLKLEDFPKFNYSKFITLEEFTNIWGIEFRSIYENNEFLEFNENGELQPPKKSESKRIKT